MFQMGWLLQPPQTPTVFCQKKKLAKFIRGKSGHLNSLRLVLVGWEGYGWLVGKAMVIRAASEKLGFPIHLPGLVPVVGSCEGVRAS